MTPCASRCLTRAAGPLLLLLLACATQAAESSRSPYSGVVPGTSYASVAAGTHKKHPSAAAGLGPAPAPVPVGPVAGPAVPLARPEDVAEAATLFSLDIARHVLLSSEGNAVVSPLGVAHLLSLLQQGVDALSDTGAQLEQALYLDKESSLRGLPRLLQNAVTKRNSKSVLETGNSLFVNSEWRLKEPFLDVARHHYDMNVTSVDFKQLDAAVAAINKWASDATHARIPALVSKGALSPRTTLVLASAVYFRGVWKNMFDVSKSTQKIFSTPSRNLTVFMMQQLGDFRLGELPDLEAQWLELPFDGEHFSMLLVLPSKRYGLPAVLRGLQPRHVASMLGSAAAKRALLIMPRFHLSTDAALTRTLKHLGLHALFGRDAKLRGVSDNPLSVSDVLHKAEMKVDEQGATATAASAVLVNTLSLISFSEDMKFFADHPFLAIIVDRTTKVPLFIGSITDPSGDF